MNSKPTALASRLFTLVSTALLLAACGDGEGPERIPGTPPVALTGVLLDSPVQGVSWTGSNNTSGVTNAAGEFQYAANEVITFSIGSIELGSAVGDVFITAFDLTGQPPSSSAFINQIVFLQSLDADGNPDNGIEIPADVAGRAQGQSLDFSSPNFAAEVREVIAAMTLVAEPRIVSDSEALIISPRLMSRSTTRRVCLGFPSRTRACREAIRSFGSVKNSKSTAHRTRGVESRNRLRS